MAVHLLEWAGGFCLAWVTLRDVFGTVVVPGRTRGSLRVARRLMLGLLPLGRRLGRPGLGTIYAPLMLLLAFVGWMLLLVLAFGLMAHAASDSFSPPLEGFGHALAVAGASMTTIGTGAVDARGAAAVVDVAAGFCGLAVMTMAVTYLLQVQNNIARRDTGVLKLATSAGQPPTALGLLERYAALGCHDELDRVLRKGRDWCAEVLQSHASHPSLIYFRSAGTGTGWPATLGALVDLSLMVEHLLDEPQRRSAAVLLREQAERLGRELADLLGLAPAPPQPTAAEVAILCERLRDAGYPLRASADFAAFARRRGEAVARIEALSRHLGTPGAPLLPQRE